MIFVNGEEKELNFEMTLEEFLVQKNFTITKVAVELNGEIIPKTEYKKVKLQSNDKLEVVRFVGGG